MLVAADRANEGGRGGGRVLGSRHLAECDRDSDFAGPSLTRAAASKGRRPAVPTRRARRPQRNFWEKTAPVAVKIKLKAPYYRIVVADARTKRDGRAIEEIGKYHPKAEPSFIEVNSDRAQHWLSVGAQPTDPVRKILEITGDWQRFKGLPGAEGTLKTAAPKEDRKEIFAAAVKETLGDAAPKGRSKSAGPGRDSDSAADKGGRATTKDASQSKADKPARTRDKAKSADAADAPPEADAAAAKVSKAEDGQTEDGKAKAGQAKGGKAEDAKAKASQAKDAKAEVGQAEDANAKDAKAEVGQAKDAKAEDAKAEVGQAKASRTKASKAEDGQAKAGQAEDAKAEDGQAKAGKAEAGKAEAGKAEAGKAEAGQAEAGQADEGQADDGKAESDSAAVAADADSASRD